MKIEVLEKLFHLSTYGKFRTEIDSKEFKRAETEFKIARSRVGQIKKNKFEFHGGLVCCFAVNRT